MQCRLTVDYCLPQWQQQLPEKRWSDSHAPVTTLSTNMRQPAFKLGSNDIRDTYTRPFLKFVLIELSALVC